MDLDGSKLRKPEHVLDLSLGSLGIHMRCAQAASLPPCGLAFISPASDYWPAYRGPVGL